MTDTHEAGKAYVTLLPSAKGFASKMQAELGGDISRMGSTGGDAYGKSFTQKAGGGLKAGAKAMFAPLAAAGAAYLGFNAAKDFLSDSVDEAREAQKVGAQTNQVIKSMGDVAGISADQVGDLATAISNKVGIDDEAIQSGENLLLTFGNVKNAAGEGNDIFNQTTQLMTDMSVAMGQDMKSSAIQLGKALNDPTKGMTALSRVGVSFTAQEQEKIKALQESGDLMGAQKVVLSEVQKQFAGSAAAQATAGEKAKVAWGNIKEWAGTKVLPLLDKLSDWFVSVLPKITHFGDMVGAAFDAFKDFDAQGVGETLDNAFGNTGALVAPIRNVAQSVMDLWDALHGKGGDGNPMKQVADNMLSAWDSIKSIFKSAVDIVTTLWHAFGDDLTNYAKKSLQNVMTFIKGAFQIVSGIFKIFDGLIHGDWKKMWDGIKQVLSGVWNVIKAVVRQGWNVITTAFKIGGTILKGIWSGIWNGIKALATAAWNGIKNTAVGVFTGVKNAIVGIWHDITSGISDAINNIVSFVTGLPGRLGGVAAAMFNAGKNLVTGFFNGLGTIISNGASFIADMGRALLNGIIGIFNKGIQAINDMIPNKIPLPGLPDIDLPDNPIPPIPPMLATGGRATAATLAIIGEGREPESVLPDSVLRGLLERAHASGAASASRPMGGAITITNWDEGVGYFAAIADDRVHASAAMAAQAGRAGR